MIEFIFQRPWALSRDFVKVENVRENTETLYWFDNYLKEGGKKKQWKNHSKCFLSNFPFYYSRPENESRRERERAREAHHLKVMMLKMKPEMKTWIVNIFHKVNPNLRWYFRKGTLISVAINISPLDFVQMRVFLLSTLLLFFWLYAS